MGRLECTTSVSNWPNNMLAKYNNVLTHNPGSVMLVVLFLSISCTIYTVRVGSLPDFSEPTLVCLCVIRVYFRYCKYYQTTIGLHCKRH